MAIKESRREKIVLRCLGLFPLVGCISALMIPLTAHTNLFGELSTEVILGCFVGIFLATIGLLATTFFVRRHWGERHP